MKIWNSYVLYLGEACNAVTDCYKATIVTKVSSITRVTRYG